MTSPPVVLVTVTYGRRWHLLSRVLASAFDDGVSQAVVVNNGAQEPVAALCRERWNERVAVVDLGRNRGSAPGFAAGMAAARRLTEGFVLVLDDDNVIEPGGLAQLIAAHAEASVAPGPLIVLGFRPENQSEIAAGEAHRALPVNAFLGFELGALHRKLWRRVRRRWWPARGRAVPAIGSLDNAPYSGMLFRAPLLDVIGLPDPAFVLYADDTEFSYRVKRLGGRLLVVTGARVTDVERSWNTKSRHRSAFDAWLLGGSDLGVYYAARNRSCFERHYVAHNAWLRALNRCAFLAVMGLLARRHGKAGRWRLLREAVRDGEAGRLGVRDGFELR